MYLNTPRGLGDADRLAERWALHSKAPLVRPLSEWRQQVIARRTPTMPNILIPHFDPAGAGIDARVALILESPGPMTIAGNGGSGFISVDNDDPTAANLWNARNEAGLHEGVIHWNICPWVLGANGNRAPKAEEIGQGAMELRRLLPLLPELRVVVLMGEKSRKGWDKHVDPYLDTRTAPVVLRTAHTSGQAFAQGLKADVDLKLARAARIAG